MSEEFDKAYWDAQYREQHGGHHETRDHDHAPNPHLVAEAGGLPSGSALDAGCGEGAEARWLAGRGWRVTAVDIAAGALRRAAERAANEDADAARRIEWLQADLAEWRPPEGRFDVVTTHYVHTPAPPEELLARLARAVAPGGTLLFVGHHPTDPHRHHVDAASAASVTPEEAAAVLDPVRWELVVAETRTRRAVRAGGQRTHPVRHGPARPPARLIRQRKWPLAR